VTDVHPGEVYRERATGLEFMIEVVQDCPHQVCPSRLGPRESAGIAIGVSAHGQWKALTVEDILDPQKFEPMRIPARLLGDAEGCRL